MRDLSIQGLDIFQTAIETGGYDWNVMIGISSRDCINNSAGTMLGLRRSCFLTLEMDRDCTEGESPLPECINHRQEQPIFPITPMSHQAVESQRLLQSPDGH